MAAPDLFQSQEYTTRFDYSAKDVFGTSTLFGNCSSQVHKFINILYSSPNRCSVNLFGAVYIFCLQWLSAPPFLLHEPAYRSWSECAAWSMTKGLQCISPAKSRSWSFVLNFHLIPVFPSCNVFVITQSTTSRNSKLDELQPCFTPVPILNHSVVFWPSTNAHSKSS